MIDRLPASSKVALRFALVVLSCALALATALSAFTIAELSDHDCQGDDCPICVVLDMAQAMLSTFAASATAQTISCAAFAFAFAAAVVWILYLASQTPVTRGDRLLI